MNAHIDDGFRIASIATCCLTIIAIAAVLWLSLGDGNRMGKVCPVTSLCVEVAGQDSLDLIGGTRPLSEISCATFQMPHCAATAEQPLPI